MKIAFAGTPEFSVHALNALHTAGHEIAAVFTQPDRPFGRGRKLRASPVAERAAELGLPIFKPEKFDAEAREQLAAAGVETMVVVAFGQILPQAVLDTPTHGCLNIHASLLPRWRGAAPLQRAILAGDDSTGVTIMQMDAGLDTGPMLLKRAVPITDKTTTALLHDTLAKLGGELIVEALAAMASDQLKAVAQADEGVTYAHKISKDEAQVDWSDDATTIARAVRAYQPVPVSWSQWGSERIRIHSAEAVEGDGEAGQAVIGTDGYPRVACGAGSLRLVEIQRPGGKRLDARQALQGWDIESQRFS